jgi:hypothetical protein
MSLPSCSSRPTLVVDQRNSFMRHASKGKASQDPLGDAEEVESNRRDLKERPARTADLDYDNDSEVENGPDFGTDSLEIAMNGAEFDDDTSKCSDPADDYAADEDGAFPNKVACADIYSDSGYNSDGTDVSMKRYDGKPAHQKGDTSEPDEFGEAIRAWKALCYEDLVL